MRSLSVSFAVLLAVAAGLAPGVRADSTVIQAHADGLISGEAQTDTQGPAGAGSLLASVTWSGQCFEDILFEAQAKAAQDEFGRSAARVLALPDDPTNDHLLAETRWARTVIPPGTQPAEYVYQFFIEPAILALRRGCQCVPPTTVGYEVTVKLDGTVIFSSTATLGGTPSNPVLTETGTDLGGTFFHFPLLGIFGYLFSSFDGVISLGHRAPGVPFTVESTLRIVALDIVDGMGVKGAIGDPLELGSDPGVFGEVMPTEPVGVESQAWSNVKALYR
jgi:hypothetical protein